MSLLPIWMLGKGELDSLCKAHGVPVLAPHMEICSDMLTMFTCTGLDSCAPIPSVLSDSWMQASSMCYPSANPKIINQVTWFYRFWMELTYIQPAQTSSEQVTASASVDMLVQSQDFVHSHDVHIFCFLSICCWIKGAKVGQGEKKSRSLMLCWQ